MKATSDTYAHRLVGDCHCGARHDPAPPDPQPGGNVQQARRIVATYDYRGEDGAISGGHLPVDLAANAASLGAETIEVNDLAQLKEALKEAKRNRSTTVIKIETDPKVGVGRYETWWDVPVAEVSTVEQVIAARAEYETLREPQRHHL